MIKSMLVNCEKGYKFSDVINSMKSCDQHGDVHSPGLMEVVGHQLEAKPTSIEKKVATNVVTRLLHLSDYNCDTSHKEDRYIKKSLGVQAPS